MYKTPIDSSINFLLGLAAIPLSFPNTLHQFLAASTCVDPATGN